MSKLTENQKLLLLSIYQLPGVGLVKFKKLLDSFENVQDLFKISNKNLKITQKCITCLSSLGAKESDFVQINIANLDTKKCKFITIWDDQYPETLRNTYLPPYFLFYKGDISLLKNKKLISIVGTRKPSSYGENLATRVSKEFSEHGYIVVSGMAFGIDKVSHAVALKAGAPTIAVSPGGVDSPYPVSNSNIYKQIVESGLIISEYLPGTKPNKGSFLARNRIIAGLSQGTIIMEAGEKSGSLITARHAFDEDRQVFVFPGDVTRSSFAGSNNLIKANKGQLVTNIEDIFNELGVNSLQKTEKYTKLSEEEKVILENLSESPMTLEQLSKKLAKEIHVMITLCSNLEIQSIIKRDSVGRYILS